MTQTETLPGETIVQTAAAPPADTVEVAITVTAPPPPPITITATPTGPTCPPGGGLPTANSLGCEGRNCSIEFRQDGAVHWVPNPTLQPLRTAVTFINDTAMATCITTKCNTEAFNQFYRTSLASCARPPCPSNTLDCYCNWTPGGTVEANVTTSTLPLPPGVAEGLVRLALSARYRSVFTSTLRRFHTRTRAVDSTRTTGSTTTPGLQLELNRRSVLYSIVPGPMRVRAWSRAR